MNKEIKEKVREHAQSEAPREACGLIACDMKTGKVTVFPCENAAQDKLKKFHITTEEFLECRKAYGEIITVYHSHVNPELGGRVGFSHEDVEMCNECLIPFLLYSMPEDSFEFLEPEGYKPKDIVGRPFIRGFWDCYTACRDYYKVKHGVNLRYYFPPEDDALDDYDHFEDNFEKEGFSRIDFADAKKGDAMLFKIGKSKTINHAAIFLGGSRILHHGVGSKACVIDMDHRLMKYSYIVVRHRDINHG